MRKSTESFVACMSLAVQGFGFAIYAQDLNFDPFYVFASILLGACISAWYCVTVFTDISTKVSAVRGVDGQPITTWHFSRPTLIRYIAGGLLAVSVVLLLISVFWLRNRIFDVGELGAVTTVSAYHAEISYADAQGGNKVETLPRNVMLSEGTLGQLEVNQLSKEGPGFRFTIRKRLRVPWVQIDGIYITVTSYVPDFKVISDTGGLSKPINTYIAEIDDPTKAKTDRFNARFVNIDEDPVEAENGQVGGGPLPILSDLLITDGLPEPFFVVLAARSSGIYTCRVEVELSYLWQKQKLVIADGYKCVFLSSAADGDDGDEAEAEGGNLVPLQQDGPSDSADIKLPLPVVPYGVGSP